jgi:hypothetical protein
LQAWLTLPSVAILAEDDSPVFVSRKNRGHLDPSQILRIVRAATKRAGIKQNVSPHWFRHAHASHAIERGAGIHLVATLNHSFIAITGKYLTPSPTRVRQNIWQYKRTLTCGFSPLHAQTKTTGLKWDYARLLPWRKLQHLNAPWNPGCLKLGMPR